MNPIDFIIANPDKSKYICKHIKEKSYKELEDEWQEMYNQVLEYLNRQRTKSDTLLELIQAYEEYNQLLADECSELVSTATIHGWKSSRVKAGEKAREKIERLKAMKK